MSVIWAVRSWVVNPNQAKLSSPHFPVSILQKYRRISQVRIRQPQGRKVEKLLKSTFNKVEWKQAIWGVGTQKCNWGGKKMSSPGPVTQILSSPFLFSLFFLLFFFFFLLANLWQCLFSPYPQRWEEPHAMKIGGVGALKGLGAKLVFLSLSAWWDIYVPARTWWGFFGCLRYPSWASTDMLLGWVKWSGGFSWCTETNPYESSLCSRKQSPWR